MRYKSKYVKPIFTFEEIETAPLCNLVASAPDQEWGDGGDTGHPIQQSIFDNSDEDLYDFSINLED